MWWLADQLAQLARQGRRQPHPVNPNPAGTVHEGSTSDAVLKLLAAHYPAWFTFAQISAGTGRGKKALGWSLCHLRAQGRIEARGADDPRSHRYRQYRFKVSRLASYDDTTQQPEQSDDNQPEITENA
jgi:hypothetical protein